MNTCQFIPIEHQNYYGFMSDTPTDKFGWHKAYLCYYHKLFHGIKGSNIKLLEIGGHVGGSFIMWENYFSNGQIIGADIIESAPECIKSHSRINYQSCDAYTPEGINKLKSEYDIIIDDGPHTKESQIIFCQNYLSMLKPQGTAIIEDIQHYEYIKDILDNIPAPFIPQVVDLRKINNRHDDILIIITL